MDDLIVFLNARLDEDEAAAKAAASVAGPDWQFGRDFPTSYLRSSAGSILADTLHSGDGEIGPHLARHDPARVLREVEAKRAILELHQGDASEYGGSGYRAGEMACRMCGADDGWWGVAWPCPTILALAAVYSDHPDYRQEWKP